MSSDNAKSGGSPRSKPITRSTSLRRSLNLSSLIAGVRSKDSSDDSKASKKSKVSTRRQSAIVAPSISAPRASLDGRTSQSASKREKTPDSKTITRRRASGTHTRASAEEQAPMKSSEPTSISAVRATSARTRAANGIPKYRPKSQAIEPSKPSTPVKSGTRRRLSTSSEDGGKEQRKPQTTTPSPKEKEKRPISPLPQRAALKASSAVNSTPPATPSTPSSRIRPPTTPSANSLRSSPTRPAKVLKTATASAASSVVRPSSSASSLSSSFTPRTPKGSTLKSALTRSAKDKTITGSTPVKNSPITPSRDSPSPLARHSRNASKYASSSSSHVGNMSHISEANSEDSEEDDVLLLLAPVANLAAPTPAMPRIQRTRRRQAPETPSREKPSDKKDKSRLAPPRLTTSISARGHLRPPRAQSITPVNTRQSILSWEQLSNDASRTLGEGEVERMITDVPAPFSGPTSPALSSLLDIPPSPCLSAIDSPGGFGSISQVLLPDVTPSPAPFHNASTRFSVSPEAAGESSATYLRLQLVAAENLANDRLARIQAMEEEIHNLKQVHAQQMEEMASQMRYMEKEDEKAGYAAALEEQLLSARASYQQAIEVAISQTESAAKSQQDNALKVQRSQFDVLAAVMAAENSWLSVGDSCQAELDAIQGERETLALLLAELETINIYS